MSILTRLENFAVAAITASVFVIGAVAMAKTEYPAFDLARIGNGEWQAETEASFNDQNPVKEFYVQTYNALQYLAVGQVQEGVVIGKQKWLFTEEDFQVTPDFEKNLENHLGYVIETARKLEARGTQVIVSVLPDKARVMQDYNIAYRASGIEERLSRITKTLASAGIRHVAPFAELFDARHEQQVFMRTDTHWTSEGAMLVARETLEAGGMIAGESDRRLVKLENRTHKGDLYNFLDLGPYRSALGFELERASVWQLESTGATDATSLFGGSEEVIALVGTSYSADTRWSFADALEAFSGIKVINQAKMGMGPFRPMREFLAELEETGDYPEHVVWEIPERYVSQSDEQMEGTQAGS